jgi:hypothetical protein
MLLDAVRHTIHPLTGAGGDYDPLMDLISELPTIEEHPRFRGLITVNENELVCM